MKHKIVSALELSVVAQTGFTLTTKECAVIVKWYNEKTELEGSIRECDDAIREWRGAYARLSEVAQEMAEAISIALDLWGYLEYDEQLKFENALAKWKDVDSG